MIIENGKMKIKGKEFKIGDSVVANKNAQDYQGLRGTIVKVLTGDDVDTNYDKTENIIVSFETPNAELTKELEKRFSAVFQREITIEDIILDEVVCSTDEIDICI